MRLWPVASSTVTSIGGRPGPGCGEVAARATIGARTSGQRFGRSVAEHRLDAGGQGVRPRRRHDPAGRRLDDGRPRRQFLVRVPGRGIEGSPVRPGRPPSIGGPRAARRVRAGTRRAPSRSTPRCPPSRRRRARGGCTGRRERPPPTPRRSPRTHGRRGRLRPDRGRPTLRRPRSRRTPGSPARSARSAHRTARGPAGPSRRCVAGRPGGGRPVPTTRPWSTVRGPGRRRVGRRPPSRGSGCDHRCPRRRRTRPVRSTHPRG